MAILTNIDSEPVAAVCGKEVRIYGPYPDAGPRIRPLWSVREFAHRGAALLFASEHDDGAARRLEAKRKAAVAREAQNARIARVIDRVAAEAGV